MMDEHEHDTTSGEWEIVAEDEPSIEDYPVTTDRDPGDETPEWATEQEVTQRRDAEWGVR